MIGIFPGRFQPPHIGHILTLMRVYDKYDKIIVAVTRFTWWGQKPAIIEPEVAYEILKEIFRPLPKYEVILIDRGFNERTTFDDLPEFDVVITGDERIMKRLPSLGVKVDFVPRSKIGELEISGTILRDVLYWDLKPKT